MASRWTRAAAGGGRAGGGPLTRHAEEAGSVDAPSVWADEYASLRPREGERGRHEGRNEKRDECVLYVVY